MGSVSEAGTIEVTAVSADIHQTCCSLLRESGYVLEAIDGRPLDETDERTAWVGSAEMSDAKQDLVLPLVIGRRAE
jgi:hypothetical protein